MFRIIFSFQYYLRYNARVRNRPHENGEPIELATLDEVNERFPLTKYRNWMLTHTPEDPPLTRGAVPRSADEIDLRQMPTDAEKRISTESPSKEPALEGQILEPAEICAICLDTLEDDDDVRGLTCGHVFHPVCLDPWLTRRRACCPNCRADYSVIAAHPENEAALNTDRTAARLGIGNTRTDFPAPPRSAFLRDRAITPFGPRFIATSNRLDRREQNQSLPQNGSNPARLLRNFGERSIGRWWRFNSGAGTSGRSGNNAVLHL
jgi:hypothetical protein